jgi:hypothetical protein
MPLMSNVMPLELALERSRRWMVECASLVDGASFETTNRLRVAVSLLHLCIEHQTGIHTLVEHGVIGSAFALFRPQFESYVRGVWYHRCATDQQVASFIGGAEPPKMAALIQALEALPGFSDGSLNLIKKGTWRNLNDFTHGGTIQVKARNSRDEVASNYKHDHVAGVLEASAMFSMLAAVAIAAAVNSDSLAQALHSVHRRIYEPVA